MIDLFCGIGGFLLCPHLPFRRVPALMKNSVDENRVVLGFKEKGVGEPVEVRPSDIFKYGGKLVGAIFKAAFQHQVIVEKFLLQAVALFLVPGNCLVKFGFRLGVKIKPVSHTSRQVWLSLSLPERFAPCRI